jgi:hypothetical protein
MASAAKEELGTLFIATPEDPYFTPNSYWNGLAITPHTSSNR